MTERESHNLDRRGFFKLAGAASAALVGGGALAGCSGQLPFMKKNTTGTESPVGESQVDFAAETDVLIVGSGIAGFSAAMDPLEAGLSVTIAEKASLLGGDSYLASGVLYVVGTDIQNDAGIDVSVDDAWEILKTSLTESGNAENLQYKKDIFSAQTDWVNRVSSDYRVSFENPDDYVSDGSPREILLPKNGLGDMDSILKPLMDGLSQKGLSTQLNAEAVDLILDADDTAVGMRFRMGDSSTPYDIKASRIILATGGFSCNQEMIQANIPDQVQSGCAAIYANGKGLRMGSSLGGQLVDMDKYPPLISDIPQACAWGWFGPTIDINALGSRFAQEDDLYAAAGACAKNSYGYWWTIFDKQLAQSSQSRSIAQIANKYSARLVGPADSIEDLAKEMGIAADVLNASFNAYNAAVDGKKDADFKRKLFLEKLSAPYYALKQLPLRFKTVGGLKTDENAQLVDAAGGAIPNVYACGACSAYNMNGLASAAAMGMIAGKAAAAALTEEQPADSDADTNTSNNSNNSEAANPPENSEPTEDSTDAEKSSNPEG